MADYREDGSIIYATILYQNDSTGYLQCRFLNISGEQINQLRKIIMENVPTMAIYQVEINRNTSSLTDEQLALRISGIPLATNISDLEKIYYWTDCPSDVDKSDRCSSIYSLSAGCSAGVCNISASSMKFIKGNPNVIPKKQYQIVTLVPGHQISFKAYARKGSGIEHGNWSPVAMVRYISIPEIIVESEKELKGIKPILVKNEEGLYSIDKQTLEGRNIRLGRDYLMTFQGIGSLKPIDILVLGLQILSDSSGLRFELTDESNKVMRFY